VYVEKVVSMLCVK